MSKMSLSWHKECLMNEKKSLEESKEKLAFLNREVELNELSVKNYELQIMRAEKEGRTGFDKSLYGRVRRD